MYVCMYVCLKASYIYIYRERERYSWTMQIFWTVLRNSVMSLIPCHVSMERLAPYPSWKIVGNCSCTCEQPIYKANDDYMGEEGHSPKPSMSDYMAGTAKPSMSNHIVCTKLRLRFFCLYMLHRATLRQKSA